MGNPSLTRYGFSSRPARNSRGFLTDKLPYLSLYQSMPICTSLRAYSLNPFGVRGPTFGVVHVSARPLPTLTFGSMFWLPSADLTPDNRKTKKVGS